MLSGCGTATISRSALSVGTQPPTLVVATYPNDDLEPVAALEGLEYLRLLHLPGVRDLAPLGRLQQLRTLRLAPFRVGTHRARRPLSTLWHRWPNFPI
jgi:hypothetical protein